MAEVIYKYDVSRLVNVIEMPIGAKILSCKLHNGKVYIWAFTDDNKPTEIRVFRGIHTGYPGQPNIKTHEELEFIDTIQFSNGIVAHYFEVISGYRD